MVRSIHIKTLKKIMLEEGIEAIFKEEISSYGTGAHVRAPSKYKGHEVIVIILK